MKWDKNTEMADGEEEFVQLRKKRKKQKKQKKLLGWLGGEGEGGRRKMESVFTLRYVKNKI